MALQIGGALDRGFDDPLGLMSDCHRRIERFLATLQAVVDEAAGGPLTDLHRDALDTALRYFAGMAPKHTADEEVSLFPRLRRRLAGVDDPAAKAIVARMVELEDDHRAADAAHAEVEALGRRWLEAGRLSRGDLATLAARLQQLAETYREHITHEDDDVFPLAAQVLPPEQLAEVGREMAERRGSLTCSQRKVLERGAKEADQ